MIVRFLSQQSLAIRREIADISRTARLDGCVLDLLQNARLPSIPCRLDGPP